MNDMNDESGKPDSTKNQGGPTPEALGASEAPIPKQIEPAGVDAAREIKKDEEAKPLIKAKDPGTGITTGEKDILDRIKTGERWMIIFTAVVAFTTFAQFIQSGCNNAATSKQTDKLIWLYQKQTANMEALGEITGKQVEDQRRQSRARIVFEKFELTIPHNYAHIALEEVIKNIGLLQATDVNIEVKRLKAESIVFVPDPFPMFQVKRPEPREPNPRKSGIGLAHDEILSDWQVPPAGSGFYDAQELSDRNKYGIIVYVSWRDAFGADSTSRCAIFQPQPSREAYATITATQCVWAPAK